MTPIGTALEEYQIDFNIYPKVTGDASDLVTYIQPTYVKRLPLLDAWNNPIHVVINTSNPYDYTVWSGGKDGASDSTMDTTPGPTTDFNADIVFSNGQFYAWPEGMQQ